MTLFEQMMEPCHIMDRITVSDGMGGYEATWTEGAAISCAIGKDSSTQGKIAEKEGVTEIYTITTYRENALHFHDVIKRDSDGQILRVTSNAKDNQSPSFATFSMAQVSAEAWSLTDG